MPSLIDLRRRIRAVSSTQQITKAMKTVAASKLRRAQDRIVRARPFARLMLNTLNSLATRCDPELHPLLAPAAGGADRPTLLFVVTADKGLCGSFNSNLLRRAGNFVGDAENAVALGVIGRKGRDFFVHHGFDIRYEDVNLFNALKYTHAQSAARAAMEAYIAGDARDVYLLYNEFKSVLQQRVVIERLLPIPRLEHDEQDAALLADHLFEPTPKQIFEELLPRHVETQMFRAMLESIAAEHAARMTAMDAATRNAGEMIDQLTLYMNKMRQATITRELIEVVSGAEAL